MKLETATALCEKLTSRTDYTEPFKLSVIEDFLSPELLREVHRSFPSASDPMWETSRIAGVEQKRRTTWGSVYDVPEGIREVVEFLNSSLFLRKLSLILDIPKLMPDPYFTGGGLNESFCGDFLDVHVDGNYHDASGLNRRVNAILYLNPTWDQKWGGNFGMYSERGSKLVREFAPLDNRLVVFDTSDSSFHGYPDPIECPNGISRKSLILYYYTKAPQKACETQVKDPHSALWVKKGLRDRNNKQRREFY
tara:strand:+ start:174 stop:926 length:753 start_codon:yes stop_codon:yes gene_type:complete